MTGPNQEENSQGELRRAEQALAEATTLIQHGMGSGAVSRAYYVASHAVSAVLVRRGLQARTHRGVQSLFDQHLVAPGLLPREHLERLARLEQKRGVADYQADQEIPIDQARSLVADAAALLAAVKALLDAWPG